ARAVHCHPARLHLAHGEATASLIGEAAGAVRVERVVAVEELTAAAALILLAAKDLCVRAHLTSPSIAMTISRPATEPAANPMTTAHACGYSRQAFLMTALIGRHHWRSRVRP